MMLGATRCLESSRHALQQALENVPFGSPSGSIFEALFGASQEGFLEGVSGPYFLCFFGLTYFSTYFFDIFFVHPHY